MDRGDLVNYSPQDCKDWDTTEVTKHNTQFSYHSPWESNWLCRWNKLSYYMFCFVFYQLDYLPFLFFFSKKLHTSRLNHFREHDMPLKQFLLVCLWGIILWTLLSSTWDSILFNKKMFWCKFLFCVFQIILFTFQWFLVFFFFWSIAFDTKTLSCVWSNIHNESKKSAFISRVWFHLYVPLFVYLTTYWMFYLILLFQNLFFFYEHINTCHNIHCIPISLMNTDIENHYIG